MEQGDFEERVADGPCMRLSWNRRSLTDGPTVGSSAASAVDETGLFTMNVDNSMMQRRRMAPVNNGVVVSEIPKINEGLLRLNHS